MATFLELAVPFVELGIPVFPLPAVSKEPPPGLPFLERATCDEEALLKLAEEHPGDCNIALLMRDGEHCALEFDVHGGMKAAASEHGEEVPMTLAQVSGRGFSHWIFKHTEESRKLGNRQALLAEPCRCDKRKQRPPGHCGRRGCGATGPHHHHEWFSFRAHNKYLVGAGSIHPDTGRRYKSNFLEPIPIPSWLCQWVGDHTEAPEAKRPKGVVRVCESFDFDDFCDHYEPVIGGIREVRSNWHVFEMCPGVGRRHDHSILTGFYWDGEVLGIECFAGECPLHGMTIGPALRYMNEMMVEAGYEPYREPI